MNEEEIKKPAAKVTIPVLRNMKKRGEPIAALSIYDALHARLFDRAGGDVIIVGDSAAMTVQGRANTLAMTMDEMVMYAQAVRRGTHRLFVVGDMPLGSYEISDEEAVRNALRFLKEAEPGCNAVKVETNMAFINRIRAIADICLVVAHLGLNPNKAEILGGYRTQGKTKASFDELVETAVAAEAAGACMILLESVTEEVSEMVKNKVDIPVLGIAAGRKLDGQLVISSDLLGLYEWPGNPPIHFEQFHIGDNQKGGTISDATLQAFSWYVKEVKGGRFPTDKHVHHLPKEELVKLLEDENGHSSEVPIT